MSTTDLTKHTTPGSTPSTDLAPVDPDASAALSSAKPAVGTGSSPFVAQLIALALICLGAVGIEEGLVRTGAITETSWTSSAVSTLDGIQHGDVWVLVTGIVAILVGLLLLVVVFRRRPRWGIALAAQTGVELRPTDLAKVAESLLAGAGAVTGSTVRATRRKVTARVSTGSTKDHDDEVREDVKHRLEPVLDALEHRPRLRVKIHNESV